mmetsp:Transcript_54996/g.103029  ORF Transcript_54996/g.103029 Transcript_54996/m.103029 type:complete len:236 (-) Transcript_54996:167-874(-)
MQGHGRRHSAARCQPRMVHTSSDPSQSHRALRRFLICLHHGTCLHLRGWLECAPSWGSLVSIASVFWQFEAQARVPAVGFPPAQHRDGHPLGDFPGVELSHTSSSRSHWWPVEETGQSWFGRELRILPHGDWHPVPVNSRGPLFVHASRKRDDRGRAYVAGVRQGASEAGSNGAACRSPSAWLRCHIACRTPLWALWSSPRPSLCKQRSCSAGLVKRPCRFGSFPDLLGPHRQAG